jgi:Pvc16 N-terminal domain
MSFEVPLIRDVTVTLKNLLLNIPGITVTFDLPDETTTGMGASLVLYSVSENQYLKNQEFGIKSYNELVPPPVIVDLYYLIVPFSSGGPPSDIARENEQMLLTAIIRTLYDNSVISGPQLADSLIETGNTELHIIPNELSLEQMNNLWSMYRKPSYHVCLSYLVTPLKIPSTRILDVTRVVSEKIDFVNKDD